MYGPVLSVFVKPLSEDPELQWSRGEISLAFTLGSLCGSLVSSIVGRQLDRYGARFAVVGAGMIISGVLLGLAMMQEVWQFWILFGAGRTAALAGIYLGTAVGVSNWFIRKRGRAVSFISIGLRSGQAVFPLFIAPIIIVLSWRHAYAFLAVVCFLLIVVPGYLFMRRRPEDFGMVPDGDSPVASAESQAVRTPSNASQEPADVSFTLAQAVRTPAFWLLIVATMTVVFANTAVNLHATASFRDRGLGEEFAGLFVFIFCGTAALSAYGWGTLMDKINVRWGALIATMFSGSSMLVLMASGDLEIAVLFGILFGLGTGGWTLAQVLLFANYFGRAHLGSIRGVAQMASGPVAAAGPLMAGLVYDATDSYTLAFQIFVAAFILVAVCLLLAKPPKASAGE